MILYIWRHVFIIVNLCSSTTFMFCNRAFKQGNLELWHYINAFCYYYYYYYYYKDSSFPSIQWCIWYEKTTLQANHMDETMAQVGPISWVSNLPPQLIYWSTASPGSLFYFQIYYAIYLVKEFVSFVKIIKNTLVVFISINNIIT